MQTAMGHQSLAAQTTLNGAGLARSPIAGGLPWSGMTAEHWTRRRRVRQVGCSRRAFVDSLVGEWTLAVLPTAAFGVHGQFKEFYWVDGGFIFLLYIYIF